MLYNIANPAASGASAVTTTFRSQSKSFNAVLIGALVGGSGHAAADWDAHKLNITLKSGIEGVPDMQIAKSVRMGDLFDLSDYNGGFSEHAEGTDGTWYWCLMPIGRVIMRGDDQLEGSLYLPGDGSATYQYRISLVDAKAGTEEIRWYESIAGNGDDMVRKNAEALYLRGTPDGTVVTVMDQTRTLQPTDYDVIGLGNAAGQMEAYETFGQLWSDTTGFTQEVTFNVADSAKALVQGRHFSVERYNNRSENEAIGVEKVRSAIELENPEKYAILRAEGLV